VRFASAREITVLYSTPSTTTAWRARRRNPAKARPAPASNPPRARFWLIAGAGVFEHPRASEVGSLPGSAALRRPRRRDAMNSSDPPATPEVRYAFALRPEHLYKLGGLLFLLGLAYRFFDTLSRTLLLVSRLPGRAPRPAAGHPGLDHGPGAPGGARDPCGRGPDRAGGGERSMFGVGATVCSEMEQSMQHR
jgi:hypothetical protein